MAKITVPRRPEFAKIQVGQQLVLAMLREHFVVFSMLSAKGISTYCAEFCYFNRQYDLKQMRPPRLAKLLPKHSHAEASLKVAEFHGTQKI